LKKKEAQSLFVQGEKISCVGNKGSRKEKNKKEKKNHSSHNEPPCQTRPPLKEQ
jgi:hypothetical protein